MQMQSLHGFCKVYKLPKSTAYKRLNDAGFNTSQGLDESAIAFLVREFKLKAQTQTENELREVVAEPPQPLRAGGLVPIGARGMMQQQVFDAASYQADKKALQMDAQKTAAHLNGALIAYAQARFASVFADIDLAADSMRANALGAMGFDTGKLETVGTVDCGDS